MKNLIGFVVGLALSSSAFASVQSYQCADATFSIDSNNKVVEFVKAGAVYKGSIEVGNMLSWSSGNSHLPTRFEYIRSLSPVSLNLVFASSREFCESK